MSALDMGRLAMRPPWNSDLAPVRGRREQGGGRAASPKRCSPTSAHLIAKAYTAPPLPRPHAVVGSNRLSFNSEGPLTAPLL